MEKEIFTIKEVEIAIINLRRTRSTAKGLLGHEAMQVLRKLYKELNKNELHDNNPLPNLPS